MEEKNGVADELTYDEGTEKKVKWSEFIETIVIDFFDGHKLEKMSLEDGNGNKAKISRTKDNELKIEQSSITII